MMKKFKEMTWDMHALHLFLFVLGAVAVIVFAVHHDNPKLEGNPLGVIVLGAGFMGGAVWSFVSCLLEKEKGETNPGVSQPKEDRELSVTR